MTVTAATIQETDRSIGSPADRWNLRDRIFIALLAFCTFALYVRTGRFDFVGYDDQVYVFANPHVQHVTFESFRWAMTAIVSANWHPLTLVVELLISLVFGPSDGAFHLTNTLLHTLNVVLLYVLLRTTTGRSWPAFFTAMLWGLHPLRAESVAWISELKDVLCGLMWFSCLLAYVRYSRRRTVGNYGIVILFLVLALLAKPMAGTLPCVLLLMDYWPLNRDSSRSQSVSWTRRVLEKLPMLGFAIADLAYAMHTQRTIVTPETPVFPVGLRIKNALLSEVDYLRDIFFPHHLTIFYPHPAMVGQSLSLTAAILAALLLAVITLLVCLRAKAQPYLLFGWFWFMGTLIPVIGLVQVGQQSRADRYTYLPSIGITLAVVWMGADIASRRGIFRIVGIVAGAVAACMLAIASFFTIGHWQNTVTLFEYCRSVQPDNFLALTMHAANLRMTNDTPQALVVSKQAVAVAPKSDGAHAEYGMALAATGKLKEGANQLAIALHLSPGNSDFWDELARVLDLQADEAATHHDPAESKLRQTAILYMRYAVHFNPDDTEAQEHLAFQLAANGKLDEALEIWQSLVQSQPKFGRAQGDYADALRLKSDLPGAVEHYRAALAAGEKNPDWETQLAYLVATNPQSTMTEVEPMVTIAKDACDQTNNRKPGALDAYAACLARVGRFDDAVASAQQAIAQANADKMPAVAAGIQKRLALYQHQLPYVAGEK